MEEAASTQALTGTEKERETAMVMHLSGFLGWLVPIVGFLVPLIIWILKKDQSEYINVQGKILFNYWISYLIYSVVAGILCFVLVGFLLLAVIFVISVVETIRAALRAREGAPPKNYLWSFNFFKVA